MAGMQRIAEDTAPADERLVALARLHIEHFRRYPAWGRIATRVLTPGLRLTDEVPTNFGQGYRETIDLIAALIATGQGEGVLRAGNPRALARMFSALVASFHVMDPDVSDYPVDFPAEEFLEFVAQTFAARRVPGRS